MAAFLNQYSFVLIAAGVGLVLALILWRTLRPRPIIRGVVIGVYVVVVIGVLVISRFPRSTSQPDNVAAVETMLVDGRPTFVMLYSHFCLGCIAALPSVRELVNTLEAQNVDIDELLLDIHSDLGREARDRFEFEFTPTYTLYDGTGNELLRGQSVFSVETIQRVLAESAAMRH